jgi:hypothetical protein
MPPGSKRKSRQAIREMLHTADSVLDERQVEASLTAPILAVPVRRPELIN